MRKKASILVLTGAVTISNIGLTTTSFAEIKDENLLTQEINVDLQNEEFIVSEIDEQVEINEDIVDENILTKEISTKVQNKVVIEQDGTARVAGEDGQIGTADDILVKPGKKWTSSRCRSIWKCNITNWRTSNNARWNYSYR